MMRYRIFSVSQAEFFICIISFNPHNKRTEMFAFGSLWIPMCLEQ